MKDQWKEKQRWNMYDADGVILIIPDWDIKPHCDIPEDEIRNLIKKKKKVYLSDSTCPCNPKVSMDGGKTMIVHNSFRDMLMVEESMNGLHRT